MLTKIAQNEDAFLTPDVNEKLRIIHESGTYKGIVTIQVTFNSKRQNDYKKLKFMEFGYEK